MKLILITILLIPYFSFAQEIKFPINSETKKIEYSDLIMVDSTLSSNVLFSRAKEWMVGAFKTPSDVIQLEDQSSGVIMAKGSIPLKDQTFKKNGHISFTMKIQVKDGRYRYWITDLEHFTMSRMQNGGSLSNDNPSVEPAYMSAKTWAQIKDEASVSIPKFIVSLNDQMKKPLSNKSESW